MTKANFVNDNLPRSTPSKLPNLLSECNIDCGCDGVSYNPVCGANGVIYYSPCHAGCTEKTFVSNEDASADLTFIYLTTYA